MVRFNPRLVAGVLAASLVLAGCSSDLSPAETLSGAKTDITKRDFRSAGIRLKSLLQQTPNDAEARFLFGKVLLELGEPGFAQVELRKAYELKYAPAEVVPPLARAQFMSMSPKVVLDEFAQRTLGEPTADADLKTTVGMAYAAAGKRAESEAAIAKALALKPGYSPAAVFQARLRADAGDFKGALMQLDAVISQDAKDADAWRVKGDVLLYGQHDDNAAAASYTKAVEAQPGDLTANNALIYLLIQQRRLDLAQTYFGKMRQQFPGHLQTKFFEALFAFVRNDFKAAREQLQPLLQRAPESLWVLHLAGINELGADAMAPAESYLSKAIQLHPEATQSRGALARVYLRTKQPAKAIEVLQPLINVPQPRAGVLSLAGEAYMEAGDPARANDLFARAVKANPEDVQFRIGQARATMASGRPDEAIAELEKLAAQDKNIDADVVLIASLMERNDLAAAAKAADVLISKRPKAAFAANTRGEVALRAGDLAAARKQFERAANLNKDYFPAVAGLASVEVNQKHLDAALKLLGDYIVAHPDAVAAHLARANAMKLGGAATADVLKSINAAVDAAPDDPRPRAMLVEHLLGSRDAARALTAAQDAVSRLPRSVELLSLLGRAQFLNGDTQQAASTFGKWAALQPKSPVPHMRVGELQADRGDFDGALKSFAKAQVIAPDSPEVAVGLIKVNLAARRLDNALLAAREYAKRHPQAMVGHLMSGDVLLARKDYAAAIDSYRLAASMPDATADASDKLYRTLRLAGKPEAAENVIAEWQKSHPRDAGLAFSAGRQAMDRADFSLAEKHFKTVLQIQPDDAGALNNLAWILVQQGRTGAVEFAQRAVQLSPETPQMLDTLATALSAGGQHQKAVEAQQLAMAKPGGARPLYRLGLAKIYLNAGMKAEAEKELSTLESLSGRPPEAVEAAALLQKLRKG